MKFGISSCHLVSVCRQPRHQFDFRYFTTNNGKRLEELCRGRDFTGPRVGVREPAAEILDDPG
jgi:hypothetical protein